MEFDIGNILYIVITLVAVIVGLLGKKKKPAAPGTGEEGSEARPGFLENLERIMTMGQENPVVSDLQPFEEDLPMEEEYVSEAVTSPEWESIKAPNIMDEYDRIMSGNDQGDTDPFSAESGRMIEPLEVIDLDMEPGTSLPDFTKNFDAREAVVYSAIINRLDY
jgi:hypothetical protein